MRLAAISDVHAGNHRRFSGPVVVGLNTRCRQVVDALRLACSTAREQRCDALLVCGDLFDGVRPEPQVIAAVKDALRQGPRDIYIIKGNHDSVSDQHGDHALGPMEEWDPVTVHVVDRPGRFQGTDAPILLVPFQSGPAAEWLSGALDAAVDGMDPDEDRGVLVLHLGIEDERTPPFLRGAADSIPATTLAGLMKECGIKVAFAGNWHQYREWTIGDQTIVQVGSLCPTGFSDEGVDGYGGLVIWETDA